MIAADFVNRNRIIIISVFNLQLSYRVFPPAIKAYAAAPAHIESSFIVCGVPMAGLVGGRFYRPTESRRVVGGRRSQCWYGALKLGRANTARRQFTVA